MAQVTAYTKEGTDNAIAAAIETVDNSTVGLGNVDNTSDLNKPMSIPQASYVDAALEGYISTEEYIPLQIVQNVEDIPSGAPVGSAFLVVNAPFLGDPPELVSFEANNTSVSGNTLSLYVPPGVEDGDLLLTFLTAQTSEDGPWNTPAGWDALWSSDVSENYRITAVRAMYVSDAESLDASYTFTATGTTGQRRGGIMVAIRGAALSDAVVVGTPVGLNGVGTDDSTVPSVTNPAPKGLHLVMGWSNGNTGSGNSSAAPGVSGGLTSVTGVVEPPSPSGGFTTLRLYERDLEASGASGSVVLDWPHLSQRGAIALAVKALEE